MTFCPACGAQSGDAGPFCTSCGKALGARASAPAPASAAYGASAQASPAVADVQPARPVGVTIVGVVLVAVSALAALATLALLMFVLTFEAASDYIPFVSEMMGIFSVIMLFVALLGLGMAAVVGAVGFGTLKGRSWAWVGVLVLMGLNALRELGALAQQEIHAVLGLIVSGLVIWYFFTPEVKRYFARET